MPARKSQKKLINLLPKEDFDRTTLGRILKWSLTTFRFIVILVEFVVIAGFLSRFWLDVRIGDLEEEIQEKSAVIASQYPFETSYRAVQNKLSIISQITQESNSVLPVLDLVSENLPRDTALISLTKTANQVDILGASTGESSIRQFINNLEESSKFTEVSLKRMEFEEGTSDIEFRIETVLIGG